MFLIKGLFIIVALGCLSGAFANGVNRCRVTPTPSPPQSPDLVAYCSECNVGKLYPVQGDKTHYYECVGNESGMKMPCPDGLVFNYDAQRCDWDDGSIHVYDPCVVYPGNQRPVLCLKCLDSKKSIAGQGTQYYECVGDGMAICKNCQKNYVFSNSAQTCVINW